MANVQQLRRSPLTDRTEELQAASSSAVSIREVPFTTQVGLRATPGTNGYTALAQALGGLPAKVGEVIGDSSSTAVLWLSPDEFLAIDQPDSGLAETLTEVLGDRSGQVLDLSANRTIIELSGQASDLVLRKSCPLDLHPRAWAVNQAYVTEVAHTPVILWRVAENTWWIAPRISFANHVVNWLLDGMIEFSPSKG
ncbi:sarcosine oxidase subunit gamma [Enteractinococcus fodinae]|uniref:Sarcosine oxidase subunit gamma n=1 Tax=Enteractinococcus fodinae TaxID=684663 RepID=A0ABU2AYH4_9MICC|nr:sarcosine oxidase subunit gamma family protein [Enteractinococcus fodinae]MDR7346402.1 sarcosine oxidase subunit gamma [Enteractinococcus fodinae]